MSMTAFHLNPHLKPLRQGDLDGLCGVYAILNALQWLLPKARDTDYLTKLFDKTSAKFIRLKTSVAVAKSRSYATSFSSSEGMLPEISRSI